MGPKHCIMGMKKRIKAALTYKKTPRQYVSKAKKVKPW